MHRVPTCSFQVNGSSSPAVPASSDGTSSSSLLRRAPPFESSSSPERERRSKDKGAELFEGDLRNPDDVSRAVEGIEGVFHMAVLPLNPSTENPRLCLEV